MNIAGTEYDINYKALSIFISGCDGACPGCHNSELWDFNIGKNWKTWKRKLYQYGYTDIIKNFWVLGGEPLLNDHTSLELLLQYLSQFKKPIWLWTRFQEQDIPNNIKQYIDYAKVGEYQCDSESYVEQLSGITLASTNQKIIKIN